MLLSFTTRTFTFLLNVCATLAPRFSTKAISSGERKPVNSTVFDFQKVVEEEEEEERGWEEEEEEERSSTEVWLPVDAL